MDKIRNEYQKQLKTIKAGTQLEADTLEAMQTAGCTVAPRRIGPRLIAAVAACAMICTGILCALRMNPLGIVEPAADETEVNLPENAAGDRAKNPLKLRYSNNIFQYDDGYIYYILKGIPYRYDPAAGVLTEVCPDEECEHIGRLTKGYCHYIDCFGTMVFRNGKCYTVKSPLATKDRSPGQQSIAIDMKTGEITEFEKYTRFDCRELVYSDDARYYCNPTTSYYSYGGGDTVHVITPNTIYRTDLTDGTQTVVKEFPKDVRPGVVAVDGDNLYYRIGLDIYRLSLSDPSVDEKVARTGSYMSYYEDGWLYVNSIDQKGEYIARVALDGSGKKEILVYNDFNGRKEFRMTDKYIYYRTNETHDYSNCGIERPCGDFYRIPKDGGEPELVFAMSDEMEATTNIDEYIVDGDYIYATYCRHDLEKRSCTYSAFERFEVDIMRIHIPTGEIDYITNK